MSKIDLSKAKIGDKFRTRDGSVMKYVCYDKFLDLYIVSSENSKPYPVQKDGRFSCERECFSDLIMQVKPLDELIEEGTKQIKENDDAIAEENELQRRQEVIALAEKLVVNEEMMKSHRDLFEAEVYAHAKTLTTYPAFVIRSAEDFIKHKNQYLKDGKL